MLVTTIALSIIILQAQPTLDFSQVYTPDKTMYMWAAVVVLLGANAGSRHDFVLQAPAPVSDEPLALRGR